MGPGALVTLDRGTVVLVELDRRLVMSNVAFGPALPLATPP
jgi:hypothetical protein